MRALIRNKPVLYGGLTAFVIAAVAVAALVLTRGKSVAALAAELRGPDPKARHDAAKKLAKIGPEAREAVPALAEALKDPDHRVRYYAAKSLAEIGPDATAATESLMAALADKGLDDESRYYVVKALSKVDLDKKHARTVLPGLVLALKDSNPKTRYYAAKCLKELREGGREALPALQEATKDPDHEVREAAATAARAVAPKKK